MVAEFLMSISASLTANAIERKLKAKPTFFEQKKISSKVDEIVIAVMEPIATFFEVEGIPVSEVQRLAGVATPVAEWLIRNPEFSFSRGLESEVITKDVLEGAAIDIELETVADFPAAFETLLRAMIDLVVKVPPVFVDWEKSSFQTIFRQTEDIKGTLASMYSMMQQITSSQKNPLGVYEKIANHRAATTALKMSIHGLRQSAVPQAELDNLFVFPEFLEKIAFPVGDVDEVSSPPDEFGESFDIRGYKNFSDFFDILSTSQTSIIRAPAGAGKTTFSNWLTSKLLKHSSPLFPIVLPLRKTVRRETLPSLYECVTGEISSVFKDLVDVNDVSSWAEEAKLVIIFEGFDEVREGDRDRVIEWIQALKAAHPGLNCLVTSRPLSTPHLSKLIDLNWRDIELRPFDLDRVVKYIKSFQEYGPEIQTGAKLQAPIKLASEWKSDPTLGPLTGNPLLLSTLLVVHHMDGELPDDRAKLYDRYIDGMLGLWELNKELEAPAVPLTKEQKKKILELIAVNMISLETDAVAEEDVSLWLSSYLKEQHLPNDVKGILDHLRERSGLLIGPGQYTFAHKSIGEFLVAQACNDGIQTNYAGERFDRLLLAQNCQMDRWTTVIFLWAGLASKIDAQQFIERLVQDGHTSLAAGLILERRKFVEGRWLEGVFWRWLSKRVIKVDSDRAENTAFIQGPGAIPSTSLPSGRLYMYPITTISGGFLHDEEFISLFFREKISSPDDWVDNLTVFSTPIWWIFSEFATPSKEFFDLAPAEMTEDLKCYVIIRQLLARLSSIRPDQRPVEKYRLDAPVISEPIVFETFVLLEKYIRWKDDIIHSRMEKNDGKKNVESDDEHNRRVFHSVARYHSAHKERIEASGFVDIVTSRSAEQIPDKLYEFLDEKIVTLGSGLSYFGPRSYTDGAKFVEELEETVNIEDSVGDFKVYDDFARSILKKYSDISRKN